MRNLKKILALVLALVMSMSLVSVAGATYAVDGLSDGDKVAEEYTEAVAVLNGLGVMIGDERGFRPQDTITRAEVATLVYRIVTGDTTENCDGAKAYADYGKFEDCADHWAKGMINFCANQGIVQGYSDTKFGPDDEVTGYQAILMLLRAIGWDKNGESNAPDWRQVSAGKAQLLGWTTNVDMDGLGNAATREIVAELLFNAIVEPQYTWTLLGGYDQDDNILSNNPAAVTMNDSLAWQNFKLAYDEDVHHDSWGRPFHVWYIESGRTINGWCENELVEPIVAIDVYAPVVTYTEATPECDIYKDMGLTNKVQAFDRLTVNGYHETSESCDAFDGDIKAISTKVNVGAQGRLTEIYVTTDGTNVYYEMVMIDEFFAIVEDVTEVKYDKNDHISKYATLYLTVFDGNSVTGYTNLELISEEDWEYEVGDVLLLNVETEDSAKNSAIVDRTGFLDLYEIIGTPDVIKEKQTAYSTKATHFVGEDEIPDAVRFVLDQAGDETKLAHYWFFDSYGNLIAAVDVEETTTYATISAIKWVDTNDLLDEGYAKVTLTYLDGTQETVKITQIDKKVLEGVEGKLADYDTGLVSSTTQYNKAEYTNVALYKVDGTKLISTTKLEGAKAWPGVPAMTAAVNATNTTKFLVWVDGDYEAFTGIKNIPEKYNSGNFWYVDANKDNHAEIVFIANPTRDAAAVDNGTTEYHTFFAFTDDNLIVKTKLSNDDKEYFQIYGGLVDGEEGSLKILKANSALKTRIENNLGKLMRVGINTKTGYVVSVEVVDNAGMTVKGGYVIWAGAAKDATLIGGVLVANGCSYDVEGANDDNTYNRGLSYSIDHDENAQLFLVFTKTVNDEKLVSLIYITTEEGATYTAPVGNTIGDLIAKVETKTAALNAALATVNSYEVAAWTYADKYTAAYDALVKAASELATAKTELETYWNSADAATKAAYQDQKTLAVYVAGMAEGKVGTAKENLTVYAAKAAVAACNAAKAANDTVALTAAYKALYAANELLVAVPTATVTTSVSGWTDAKNEAVAKLELDAAKTKALGEITEKLEAAVKATRGFDSSKMALPTTTNTTAFSTDVVALGTDAATKVRTIKAAVELYVAKINAATTAAEVTGLNFNYTAIAEAYVQVYLDAALATAKSNALAALNSQMIGYVKAEADYVYIVTTDAAILADAGIQRAIAAAQSAINDATTATLAEVKSTNETNLKSAAATYVAAFLEDSTKLPAVKKAAVAVAEGWIAALSTADYNSADWKVLADVVAAAKADILAATSTTAVTAIQTAAGKDFTAKKAAFDLTYAQADMADAQTAVAAAGAVKVADPTAATEACVKTAVGTLIAKYPTVTVDSAVVVISRDGTTATITLKSRNTNVAAAVITVTVNKAPATQA